MALGGIQALDRLQAKALESADKITDEVGGAVLGIGGLIRAIQALINLEGVVEVEVSVGSSGIATDGSHAGGLPYVPFDGYVAELHRGERVLTAEESQAYGSGQMSAATIMGTSQGATYNQTSNQINVGTNLTVDDMLFELDRMGYRLERK
jgi:hypothetical protein